jgi:hypothetical protein
LLIISLDPGRATKKSGIIHYASGCINRFQKLSYLFKGSIIDSIRLNALFPVTAGKERKRYEN